MHVVLQRAWASTSSMSIPCTSLASTSTGAAPSPCTAPSPQRRATVRLLPCPATALSPASPSAPNRSRRR
eukprot:5775078-Heterocapsa_arctica.AAC.1